MKRHIALILVVLVVPSAEGIVPSVLDLLPPGFPYLFGTCGFGVAVGLLAIGVNCGNTDLSGDATTCHPVQGGQWCEQTFYSDAEAFRWINAGGMLATITGSCSGSKHASWGDTGAILPVVVSPSCSTSPVFIPRNSCMELHAESHVQFEGKLSPPPFDGGSETIRICA